MDYKVVTSIKDAPALHNDIPTFCDTETGGLYIDPRLIQVYQEHFDYPYILDLDKIPLKDAIEYLTPKWLVFHNSAYDLGTLNFVPENLDDTLFLSKIAFPEYQKYNLDVVISNMGLSHYYDSFDKKRIQKAGFHPGAYLSDMQLRYSATDVVVLAEIWKHPKIQAVWMKNLAYKLDILSQKYAVIFQQNGILVDQKLRAETEEDLYNEIEELKSQLPEGLNVNSSPQVKKFLSTENAQYGTLVQIANEPSDPRSHDADLVIKLKSARKKYGYVTSINYPKLVTKFNVYGAATGRFTSSGGDIPNGINSQQVPKALQKILLPDTEDTVIVALDYATLELRIACSIFEDYTMYEELKSGADLHTEMAKVVSGKELHPDGVLGTEYVDLFAGKADEGRYITKHDRQLAKALNFGFVFGMGADTFQQYAFVQYGVKITLQEATEFRDKYFNKYKGIHKYHNNVWRNYKKPGFTYRTALGRIVKPRMGTEAINGPVQGSGAETTKLATHYLVQEHPEALDVIFNSVHDALYLRVPREDEEVWKERLKKAMAKGWVEIQKSPLFKFKDIPMPLEFE